MVSHTANNIDGVSCMSTTTDALEIAVANVLANRGEPGAGQTRRQRVNTDRAFARIMQLIAPRVRHFTRQYGLIAHVDDAEQVCAIAVHRAITDYDPAKARFTTFVNWQLRGELQALRYRLMTDQRSFARKVGARTVSLDELAQAHGDDGQGHDLQIEDEFALSGTEARAADLMAERTADTLVDLYVAHLRSVGRDQFHRQAGRRGKRTIEAAGSPDFGNRWAKPGTLDPDEVAKLDQRLDRDRAIVRSYLLDEEPDYGGLGGDNIRRDGVRQIGRRGALAIGKLLGEMDDGTICTSLTPASRARV